MGSRSKVVAVACAVLLPTAGCGIDDGPSTLTIEGTVSVCPTTGACADLPAAGATVTVFDETGDQVGSGTLDARGSWETEVPPGTYTAALAMPALDVETPAERSPSVSIAEGGGGDLSMTLPAVRAVRR